MKNISALHNETPQLRNLQLFDQHNFWIQFIWKKARKMVVLQQNFQKWLGWKLRLVLAFSKIVSNDTFKFWRYSWMDWDWKHSGICVIYLSNIPYDFLFKIRLVGTSGINYEGWIIFFGQRRRHNYHIFFWPTRNRLKFNESWDLLLKWWIYSFKPSNDSLFLKSFAVDLIKKVQKPVRLDKKD